MVGGGGGQGAEVGPRAPSYFGRESRRVVTRAAAAAYSRAMLNFNIKNRYTTAAARRGQLQRGNVYHGDICVAVCF